MSDTSPRWTVHVLFVDGTEDAAIGDPDVIGDRLHVKIANPENRTLTQFEACYPLAHVRVWWCDYAGVDGVRKNARGKRWTVTDTTPAETADDDSDGS